MAHFDLFSSYLLNIPGVSLSPNVYNVHNKINHTFVVFRTGKPKIPYVTHKLEFGKIDLDFSKEKENIFIYTRKYTYIHAMHIYAVEGKQHFAKLLETKKLFAIGSGENIYFMFFGSPLFLHKLSRHVYAL